MIPKTIHYCWFGGGELSPLAKKCIDSWKCFFPNYTIKEWNESNFDISIIPYTTEAYKAKKFAFVSDYARFYILYHEGGLYLDVDVEVIRPFEDIIQKGNFIGCENIANQSPLCINPGLGMGCEAGNAMCLDMLNLYATLHFTNSAPQTIVHYTSRYFHSKGMADINAVQFVSGFWIYPKEYFCPKDPVTSILDITKNTVSIHHYTASWFTWKTRLVVFVRNYFGEKVLRFLLRIKEMGSICCML